MDHTITCSDNTCGFCVDCKERHARELGRTFSPLLLLSTLAPPGPSPFLGPTYRPPRPKQSDAEARAALDAAEAKRAMRRAKRAKERA